MALALAAVAVATLLVCASEAHAASPLLSLVDTRIGSGGYGFGVGGVNPGPLVPFGAVKCGPDTEDGTGIFLQFNHFGGYFTGDNRIRSFSHTHLVGAGIHDFGNIGVMAGIATPTNATVANGAPKLSSSFSHSSEVATPGYYAVSLDNGDIRAELTAGGTHTAVHRYSSPASSSSATVMSVDVCHTVHPGDAHKGICADADITIDIGTKRINGSVLNKGGLSGRNGVGVRIWFVAEFSCESSVAGGCNNRMASGMWRDFAVVNGINGRSTKGSLGGWFTFYKDRAAPHVSDRPPTDIRSIARSDIG